MIEWGLTDVEYKGVPEGPETTEYLILMKWKITEVKE